MITKIITVKEKTLTSLAFEIPQLLEGTRVDGCSYRISSI